MSTKISDLPPQKTWDLKKAIKRLSYRLSKKDNQYKSFKPTEDDFNALLCVVGYIDRVNEKTLVRNDLFAKLFLFQLHQTIMHYNSCAIEFEIQKDICKILETPYEVLIDNFAQTLKSNQIEYIAKNSNSNEQLKKRFNKVYSRETIKHHLEEMIIHALNRF